MGKSFDEARRNSDGSLFTWSVFVKDTGEAIRVDDRTYNPEWHDGGSAVDVMPPVVDVMPPVESPVEPVEF